MLFGHLISRPDSLLGSKCKQNSEVQVASDLASVVQQVALKRFDVTVTVDEHTCVQQCQEHIRHAVLDWTGPS